MKDILFEIQGCKKCMTIKGYKKFPIKSHGNLNSNAILVSEAPGRDSLCQNKYWLGAGGKILRDCLPVNTELEDIFYLTDIVKCWPNENNENRKPFENEIENCSPFLSREIIEMKPKIILSFGGTSSSHLLNRDIKITKEHGNISKYYENTVVITLLHPSGIDRFMNRDIYKQQLASLFYQIKKNDFENIGEVFKNNKDNEITKTKSNTSNKTIESSNKYAEKSSFSIPSSGNLITQGDVSKNQIRITADFKEYFPSQSSELEIEYLEKVYRVKFYYRINKSHILKLGNLLANQINLKVGMTINMTKISKYRFRLE